ncbi:predicted GPI-anchored protein 58 [Trichoplusia ni]|uniref:Predicted GPI-anchored protein 58 n=1 Tax=Trichoplusia ni TaxID=7111 RepID=A0A7E5WFC0_TRINI|nr:predicted GPI-anchored protein 58 [Trichoplusia ni]
MRAAALILLFVCFVECRKLSLSINKHANMDFINMEIGGGRRPVLQMFQAPALEPAPKPVQGPAPTPAPAAPAPTTKAPVQASTANPAVTPQPAKPVQPMQPTPSPALIKPVPVNPAPVANTNTTTGPGSVKSLVNFYNAQGNSSLIRPYSYSQAVKQG